MQDGATDDGQDFRAFLVNYVRAIRDRSEHELRRYYDPNAQILMRLGGAWTDATSHTLIEVIVERQSPPGTPFEFSIEHAHQEGDMAQARLVLTEIVTFVSCIMCERRGDAWRIMQKTFFPRDVDGT